MKILTNLNLPSFVSSERKKEGNNGRKPEPTSSPDSSNELLKVHSKLLDETIYFAPNPKAVKKSGSLDGLVYTTEELKIILREKARGEDLKKIHWGKEIFNGRIIDD